jgi:hypothetical protein
MCGTPTARELAVIGLHRSGREWPGNPRPAVIPTRRVTCRAHRDRARARCRDERAQSAVLDPCTEPSLFAAE